MGLLDGDNWKKESGTGAPSWADNFDKTLTEAGVINEALEPDTGISSETFLMEALRLQKERGEEYDQEGGERSMAKTVEIFNVYKDLDLKESDGWLFMEILKNVRQLSKEEFHEDSASDGVAYSSLKAEAQSRGD